MREGEGGAPGEELTKGRKVQVGKGHFFPATFDNNIDSGGGGVSKDGGGRPLSLSLIFPLSIDSTPHCHCRLPYTTELKLKKGLLSSFLSHSAVKF